MNVKLRVLSAGVLFFIGHSTMAQKVKKDTAKTKHIEEVVVLGYNKRSTKAKDVSANTTITAETLESRPNASFLNSLQGNTPGVTISSNSGSPGSAKIDVVIRGISSFNASTDPLVVIDGIPTNANQFRNLNPEDIESISILRDAAATSIYGNRGANGVFIIKTKSGKYNNAFKLSYSATTGISFLPRDGYTMATAPELLTIQKRLGVAKAVAMTDEQIANYPTTDWKKVFFNADLMQTHNVSTTFGGENVNTYSSLGYFSQGGLVPGTDFQRFTFRNNINGKTKNNRFVFSSQVGLGYSKRKQLVQEDNSGVNSNTLQNPLLGATVGNPTLKSGQFVNGYDLYNTIGRDYANGNNVYVLENSLNQNNVGVRYNEFNAFGSVLGTLKILEGWTVSNRTGFDYKQINGLSYYAPWSFIGGVVASAPTANQYTPNPYGGSESISNSYELNFNSVTNTNYSLKLGDNHSIDFGAYMEYTKVHYNTSSRTQNGLDPKVWLPGNGRGYIAISNITGDGLRYVPSVSANKITAGSLSFFGTLDYDYAGKYGLSGVLRRDGSFRFSPGNKWGTFWSVAGRWNLDKEDFMKNSPFSMLKLRASYGTQGNQNIVAPAAGSNPLLVSPAISRDNAVAVSGYNNIPGYNFSVGNPFVRWEEVSQFNVGLDFMVLNNRLEGNIDYYDKRTSQLYTNVRASGVNGFYSYNGNEGGIKNTGVELNLRYHFIKTNDASFTFFINGAYNKNTIQNLAVPVLTGAYVNEVGGTMYQWNMVPYVGVNPDNGNMQYLDINGNVTETPTEADRRRTGKNYFPKFTGGFGLNASYKGFYLDATFAFQADYYRWDNLLSWINLPSYAVNGNNVSRDLLNAWTPTNRNTDIPAYTSKDYGSLSDRLLLNASWLKFKSLVIGYSLPKEMLKEGGFVKSLKVFVQGENLMLWTKWKGWDPEGLGTFPLSTYPNPRTFSIGTNIEF